MHFLIGYHRRVMRWNTGIAMASWFWKLLMIRRYNVVWFFPFYFKLIVQIILVEVYNRGSYLMYSWWIYTEFNAIFYWVWFCCYWIMLILIDKILIRFNKGFWKKWKIHFEWLELETGFILSPEVPSPIKRISLHHSLALLVSNSSKYLNVLVCVCLILYLAK